MLGSPTPQLKGEERSVVIAIPEIGVRDHEHYGWATVQWLRLFFFERKTETGPLPIVPMLVLFLFVGESRVALHEAPQNSPQKASHFYLRLLSVILLARF